MRRFVLVGLAVAVALGPAAPPVVAAGAAEATVLVGAADIADCTKDGDSKTADLLDGIPGTVFAVGDLVTDGGVFNFSNRPFAGSLGDRPPAAPVIAVAALP